MLTLVSRIRTVIFKESFWDKAFIRWDKIGEVGVYKIVSTRYAVSYDATSGLALTATTTVLSLDSVMVV